MPNVENKTDKEPRRIFGLSWFTFQRLRDPQDRIFIDITLGRLNFDTVDFGLSYRDANDEHLYHHLFSLRCVKCQKFHLGCNEHWFCELCQTCNEGEDEDDSDDLP